MASVVDKLMNHAAMNQRSGSLFRTDEVDQEQHQQTAEYGPGQELAQRNDRYGYGPGDGAGDGLSNSKSHNDCLTQSVVNRRRGVKVATPSEW
jgi:hypothetical protein